MGVLNLFRKKGVGHQSVRSETINTEVQSEDVGRRIGNHIIKKVEHFENNNQLSKKYTLNDTVQVDNLRDIVEFFEAEAAVMKECYCQSFDTDGYPLHRVYKDKDDLIKIKDLPSPYVRFYIRFDNIKTNEYVFAVEMHINSDIIRKVSEKL